MLAESSSPIDDEYDIASECSTDLLVRQEIVQMRDDIERIKDRLESFESKLADISSFDSQSTPNSQSPGSILIGPIAKSFKPVFKSEPPEAEPHADPSCVAAQDINDFFDDYGASDVDSLKKQLEDKLRKAEVEMSIQRARVFQQKAELEEMKLQLEEREAAIRKSVNKNLNEDPIKRWDRHFEFFRKK